MLLKRKKIKNEEIFTFPLTLGKKYDKIEKMEKEGKVEETLKFEEKTSPCSFNECAGGHRWAPVMVLVKCPGCQGSVLAQKMENCPYCNEPVLRTTLRHDFVPKGGGVVPRCRGAKIYGETLDILVERTGWKEIIGGKEENGENKEITS